MPYVYGFDHPHELSHTDLRELIGGKAANISRMVTQLGLPVPPGFTITTAACRAFMSGGWPAGLDDEMREHLRRVEQLVGRRFGDGDNPLLLSVRSGAPVSMPGMMDTILNLGLSDRTVEGLASSEDRAFALDCRRRFEDMYRTIVGVEEVPQDPWSQLRGAVEAVFGSWQSPRAQHYREHEGIPDDLGTAVTVQTMVFGNLGSDSGTGVLFTRNPATGEPMLYGDVLFGAQGEDVVGGDHRTEPISALDERMPTIGAELRAYAEALERHFADLCDIEFTIERSRLWLLQVRVGKRSPQAALRIAMDMANDESFPLSREEAVRRVLPLLSDPPTAQDAPPPGAEVLTSGLGASPGIACGAVVTTADAAVAAAASGRSVILTRAETSPDDVHGMTKSAGILTASGGLASHAAVVARGWGIPAVVGAEDLVVTDDGVSIAGRRIPSSEVLTVDGSSGLVYAGEVAGRRRVVPEAETLCAWANELGIPVTEATDDQGVEAAAGTQQATRDDVLRTLLIKGYATADAIAASMFCASEHVEAVVDRLVADGLAELTAGSVRLSEDGKATAAELLTSDRESWGVEQATSALDAFLALDERMKETVTAWQMRDVDGTQVINDHADEAYDADVLGRLASLHDDAVAWITPLAQPVPRFEKYRARLQRAADAAKAGDAAYVASPRVDSYHSVWFELHEELIRLAGRTRAEEVAAGRA